MVQKYTKHIFSLAGMYEQEVFLVYSWYLNEEEFILITCISQQLIVT